MIPFRHCLKGRLPAIFFLSLLTAFAVESPELDDTSGSDDEKVEKASTGAALSPVEESFWTAVRLLESKDRAKLEQGKALLIKASDDEFTHAQTMLANCYLSGTPVFPRDQKRAASLFRLSAERGNGFAMVSYAQCLLSGTGVRRDHEAATVWLRKALANEKAFKTLTPPKSFYEQREEAATSISGNIDVNQTERTVATANFLLGQVLREKKGDKIESHALFVKAAEANGSLNGLYPAAVQAALDFAFAEGTERNMDKANTMIGLSKQLTARNGIQMIHNYVSMKVVDEFAMGDIEEEARTGIDQAESQLQLGIAATFLNKKDKSYNPAEAEKWYLLSAENGNVFAQLALANCYAKGELGKPDLEAAYKWFAKAGDKNFLAISNRAICLQNGLGVAKDTKAAAEIFEKNKNQDIVCYLGSIGKCPSHIMTFEEIATLTETMAKKDNHPHALFLLGFRNELGFGVKPNAREAIKWYKKAAKLNHKEAMCSLGILLVKTSYEGSAALTEGVSWLKKAMDLENVDAAAFLGYFTLAINKTEAGKEEGRRYYEIALKIDPKNLQALNNLGTFYLARAIEDAKSHNTEAVAADMKEAIAYFERCGSFPFPNFNLGRVYFSKSEIPETAGVKKDDIKAYDYFQKAAEAGHSGAHKFLGDMHLNGLGVPVTPTEAAYHYRLAALDGVEAALEALCDMYLHGKGVSQDFDRAMFWIERLARKGKPKSLQLACDALISKGDYEQLIGLLKDLKNSDNNRIRGFAFHRLSLCYQNGYGTKVNTKKAAKYFARALEIHSSDAITDVAVNLIAEKKYSEAIPKLEEAQAESVKAQVTLANLLSEGTGVEKNPARALKLYKDAAQQGDRESLYIVAKATCDGLAEAPTIDEALAFLDQAKNLGHPQASKLIQELEKRRDNTESHPATPPAEAAKPAPANPA